MNSILISLGGNALGTKEEKLYDKASELAKTILACKKKDIKILICHGNGPQVGALQNIFGNQKIINENEKISIYDSVAMTQGYMGYQIQNAIENEAFKEGINVDIGVLISRTLVDEKDPAFKKPSKPIGPFYKKEEIDKLINAGKTIKKDSNRGYREYVPSPKPIKILEIDSIKKLYKEKIIIAGGGGGIPVVKKDGKILPVSAVVDKDLVSAFLAIEIKADILAIFTSVEHVYTDFFTENPIEHKILTVEEIYKMIENKEFSIGSMLPKIEAACKFVKENKGGKALIASVDKSFEALSGNSGTWIMTEAERSKYEQSDFRIL